MRCVTHLASGAPDTVLSLVAEKQVGSSQHPQGKGETSNAAAQARYLRFEWVRFIVPFHAVAQQRFERRLDRARQRPQDQRLALGFDLSLSVRLRVWLPLRVRLPLRIRVRLPVRLQLPLRVQRPHRLQLALCHHGIGLPLHA